MKKKGLKRPLILVSNDDGFRAEGIIALVKGLKKIGRVVVVAPDQQRSAASHSITLHKPLRVENIAPDVYAVDGTPTDCIMLAVHEILKRRPDMVVSGINHGGNIGDDVHYSGTVSAAIEGGILGIPSVAVSLTADDSWNFKFAAKFSAKIVKKILKEGLPKGVILNVNIPNITTRNIKGYVFTKQGKRSYADVIVEKIDPRGKKYYWIGGEKPHFADIDMSDCNAIRDDWISITPLRVNLTEYDFLEELSRWKL